MEPLKRCNIAIRINKSLRLDGSDNEADNGEPVFTSGSVIRGSVIIAAKHTTIVAAVGVSFAGVTTIALDSMGDFHSSKHQFLALKMPPLDLEHHLPANRILLAGTTVEMPFDFTVPHRLSVSACIHNKQHDHPLHVERHTRPPPSSGNWGSLDKVPGGTRISYVIRAEVVRRLGPGSHDTIVERAERPVRVLPALPEDPPLHGKNDDGDVYRCSNKRVPGSRFSLTRKAAVGSITASMKQPRAVRLTGDGGGALGSCAQVHFEFLPSRAGVMPPKIRVKSCKMVSTTVYTWTGSEPQNEHHTYTHHASHSILYLPQEHIDWTSLALQRGEAGDGMTSYGWHDSLHSNPNPNPISSRDITQDGSQSPHKAAIVAATAACSYTTSLSIPFTLLKKGLGFLVPTFHSCLISRAYALQLSFAVGAAKSNISLEVPVQISVEPISSDPDTAGPPSFSSVMADVDDDDELCGNAAVPFRSTAMDEMQFCSGVLPPEYDAG